MLALSAAIWAVGARAPDEAAAAEPDEPAPATDKSSGFVKLIVDGSGDVIVDGKPMERARLGKPLALAEGRHRVELRGAAPAVEPRWITVQRGTTQTLRMPARRQP